MLKRIFFVFLCTLALFLPPKTFGASAFNTPFSYYAEQQDIHIVLMQFARAQGYSASISPAVEGKISGRFDTVNPEEFLETMYSAFQVSWYRLGKTLHFYHSSEYVTGFLSPRSMTAEQMFSLLKEARIFSPDLIPRLSAGSNIINLQGPPSYIETIMNAANSFEQTQMQNIIMKVFPLKYAWADDITISSMDKDITIPGIASILRAMLTGQPVSASKQVNHSSTVEGLNGKGLSAQKQDSNPSSQNQTSPMNNGTMDNTANAGASTASTSLTAINIMADPRVNAVIVNDAAYRMPYYAEVIRDLDKPVELVEIHAAIVDINSNYSHELGISYQGANPQTGSGGHFGFGGEFSTAAQGTSVGLPALGTLSGGGLSLSTVYTYGADFFLAKVNALQQDGEARMLGKPSVLTVDNIQATLENTSTYYIKVGGYESVDLFEVSAGTVLSVTPHIIKNDDGSSSIKLAVTVQDNQDDGSGMSLEQGDDAIRPIKQTKINTQAIVRSHQSLLIGGYFYEEEGETDSGIPILKNIPVLGHLFKTSEKNTRRMERLILITPRIIRLDEIPQTPAYIENPNFVKSPTQTDYEQTIPVEKPKAGGCSKNSPSVAAIPQTTNPATQTGRQF